MRNGQQIIFLHIPKTAGTSIQASIARHFDPSRCLTVPTPIHLAYLSDETLAGFDFIHGHIGYGVFERVRWPHRKVTALRHPVDRVVSLYYYQHGLDEQDPLAQQPLARAAKRMSLEEFIDSDNPMISGHIDNAQTWHLFRDFPLFRRAEYRDWAPRDILARAKENLATFDVVCVQDHLEDGLKLLEARLGLAMDPGVRANATARRPALAEVPARVVDKLIARNPLDLELYETAIGLFRAMAAAV